MPTFSGFTGEGGPATSANLYPSDVAVDSAGNLYISDQVYSSIRKVTAATGIITTVAGIGTSGYSGDGGLATTAKLNFPVSLALDSFGNLYIADYFNNAIRKVDATGIISTVAGNGTQGYSGDGGLAISAKLYGPAGIAVDAAGNLYIAEEVNNTIRKVTAVTGIITTVAGNGNPGYTGDGGLATSSRLNSPVGVTVDIAGNLFISDYGNNVIREVAATTGIITTMVGNGARGYSGDNGSATSASLNGPNDVVVDNIGNLFIADTYNRVVRKVLH
jgi:sugar lactone lactonase YvrE